MLLDNASKKADLYHKGRSCATLMEAKIIYHLVRAFLSSTMSYFERDSASDLSVNKLYNGISKNNDTYMASFGA